MAKSDSNTELAGAIELADQLKERDEQLYSLTSVIRDRLTETQEIVTLNLVDILEGMLADHSQLSRLKVSLCAMQEVAQNG